MKDYQLKRLIIVLITIGFLSVSIVPNINGTIITQKQNNRLIISRYEAQKVAETKISLSKFTNYYISDSVEILNDENLPIIYIFYLNPQGYIVIPANRNLPPVIAYSFENEFGEINQNNILLQLLKADISNRIDNIGQISNIVINNRYEQWDNYINTYKTNQINIFTKIGPLLDTKWSQGSPYNNFCPIDLDSGKRSVAGCPAVAMAQILNYHRTTQNIQFCDEDDYLHNYEGNRYTIDDDFEEYDFPSFPELNNHLNTLQNHYLNEIPLTDDDKATINFACGIAANQVYHPSGSGTWGVNQAFDAYQRFSFNDIELLQEGSDVYTRLQSNILDGLPAHIAVVDNFQNPTVGHNMVVDGYSDDGSFHINFGWGGSYNGWYMLPKELPFELTVLEGLIIDIDPVSQKDEGLKGQGVLNWDNLPAGSTTSSSFIIWNDGDFGSSIDWEILSWPEWGVWTFEPNYGENLKPEDGELTIDVTVTAPDEKDKKYAGYIKVVNKNDISDYCLIHISLKTPKNYKINNLENYLFERFPLFFKLIQNIIKS